MIGSYTERFTVPVLHRLAPAGRARGEVPNGRWAFWHGGATGSGGEGGV